MLGAWTGRHTLRPWGDTASFLRWEHMYVNGNGCALKAIQSLLICCSLVLFWFRPGNARGARVHGAYFDFFLFSIILETGCPHS